jgi:hypothetical protein
VPTRHLGKISAGSAAGIEVVHLAKHAGVDPDRYTGANRLRIDTDPFGRGSKWLDTITDAEHFDLVRRVLEGAGAQLGTRGIYRMTFEHHVGVTGGRLVSTLEVRFDGRYAHGYPCPP